MLILPGKEDFFRNVTWHNELALPEVRAGQRDTVFRLLAQAGASTAEATYDGSGDEGHVIDLTARGPDGGTVPLELEVEEAVRDFVIATLPLGWEIDAGGDGVVVFDVSVGQVRYSHSTNYTEVDHDEWVA